jgi:uncharacterized membrane protein
MNWKKVDGKVALPGRGTTRRFASEMAGTDKINNNSSMFHISFVLSLLCCSVVVGFVVAALVNTLRKCKIFQMEERTYYWQLVYGKSALSRISLFLVDKFITIDKSLVKLPWTTFVHEVSRLI